jgi:FG-GAP-like repeat/Calx-beta domain
MSIHPILRSISSSLTRRRPIRRRSPASRLCLESLEDRCLLSFSPAVNYPVGVNPGAVVTGDFNADGRLDVAVAKPYSNTLSILLGNANGTFQAARNSATGASARSMAVGDFNADGKLDLATANAVDLATTNSGSLSILLGDGRGAFQAPSNIEIGSNPSSVSVGDFNGDGKLDLGVASIVMYQGYYGPYAGAVHDNVLLGNGDGSFVYWHMRPVDNRGYQILSAAGAAADFNGDGKLDFATAVGTAVDSRVAVAPGSGDGRLGVPTFFDVGSSPFSVSVGDFDGDGKLDLVTANMPNISVLLGTGTGSFRAAQNDSAGSQPRTVSVGDFDGDGKLDLVTGNAYNVGVLLGTGTGSFRQPLNVAAGLQSGQVSVGDFNGDGRPDVVSANYGSDDVSVLLNDGTWPAADTPSITVNDLTVAEGNSGTTAATFTVSLSAAYGQPVTIHYATANGSATAGSDYQPASGTLTITAGQTTATITVMVKGNRVGEANETFVVDLSGATNATIADGQGAGTILDDEPRISIGDVSKAEGKKGQTTVFTFTVTLSAAYDQAVTMSFDTVNGAATTSDNDYIARTGTLTFNPGETSKTITIEVKGDSKKEASETFYLDLSGNSVNSLFTKKRGIGTIRNDD